LLTPVVHLYLDRVQTWLRRDRRRVRDEERERKRKERQAAAAE
jgi:hypothetical protein